MNRTLGLLKTASSSSSWLGRLPALCQETMSLPDHKQMTPQAEFVAQFKTLGSPTRAAVVEQLLEELHGDDRGPSCACG